jgi:hypothetical protein
MTNQQNKSEFVGDVDDGGELEDELEDETGDDGDGGDGGGN